jgi:hypothetical protein
MALWDGVKIALADILCTSIKLCLYLETSVLFLLLNLLSCKIPTPTSYNTRAIKYHPKI